MKTKIPLRPSQFAEHQLVTAILDGGYPAGATLPNERTLSETLGVTRPTLREALHRLAALGWLTIRQGKPTVVNNYWKTGGLSILGTLARYNRHISNGFIIHLLEFRSQLMPPIAKLAVQKEPQALIDYLENSKDTKNSAEAYAGYDWSLQLLMAKLTANPINILILNDFSPMYTRLARRYFRYREARRLSGRYYERLYRSIGNGEADIEGMVRETMEQAITIWKRIDAHGEEGLTSAARLKK